MADDFGHYVASLLCRILTSSKPLRMLRMSRIWRLLFTTRPHSSSKVFSTTTRSSRCWASCANAIASSRGARGQAQLRRSRDHRDARLPRRAGSCFRYNAVFITENSTARAILFSIERIETLGKTYCCQCRWRNFKLYWNFYREVKFLLSSFASYSGFDIYQKVLLLYEFI